MTAHIGDSNGSTERRKVSVIVPTYRHRAFVLETLESIWRQTFTNYEVIVVNDGSTDDTRELLRPIVAAGQIRYFEQENRGQSRARNAGLAHATGEYVAFLDDDDLWPPDKLEWQTQFLDEHVDVGIVGGTLQAIDERGSPTWKGKFFPTITFEALFLENPFFSPGQTLIRASLLERLGGMDASIWGADDWDLWFRTAKTSRIVMVDRLALYYRQHAGNSSKQADRLLRACCQTIESHLPDASAPNRDELRIAFQRTAYRGLGSILARDAHRRLRHGDVLGAFRAVRGVLPIWRGVLLDRPVRAAFLRDVVRG